MKNAWTRLFIKTSNGKRDDYIWNTAAAGASALQTVLLLVAIGRICGSDAAGLFSIGYAIANLLFFVGTMYGRRFQVSDIREEYQFEDYLSTRILTCTIMMLTAIVVCICGYIFADYDLMKCMIIMLLSGVRCTDAFVEVHYGRFQQLFKLYISGRINVFRLATNATIYICALAIMRQLLVPTIIFLCTSVVTFSLSSALIGREFHGPKVGFRFEKIREIIKHCFPLFVSIFLLMYIVNAPKYVIDTEMTYTDQAVFNYISMPVFAIRSLSNVIFNPIMADLSLNWEQKDYSRFRSKVYRQFKIIIGICLVGTSLAYLFGIPVLSWLYNYDLSQYRIHLTILIAGGGFHATANFLVIVTTIMRIQWRATVAYIITAALTFFLGPIAIENFGLIGASFQFTFSMIVLAIIMIAFAMNTMSKPGSDARLQDS